MSDPQHQSLIKTPKQLIVTIVAAFLVPIVVILLLVNYVTSARKLGAGSQGMTVQAVDERIAPIAKLELVDANAPRTLKDGKAVYEAVCTTCHGAGIAGAPKFADNGAWGARIAQGAQTLYDHAIKGYQGKAGNMPAKGGNPDLDDVEVQRAVVYMANAAGGKLPEPAAPAPKAAPAVAAAPAAAPLPVADAAAVAAIAAINAGKPAASSSLISLALVSQKYTRRFSSRYQSCGDKPSVRQAARPASLSGFWSRTKAGCSVGCRSTTPCGRRWPSIASCSTPSTPYRSSNADVLSRPWSRIDGQLPCSAM